MAPDIGPPVLHAVSCTGPNDVLEPVIGYMNGVATEAFGPLGLCPFNFTLGIFDAATRTRKEAWVTIYYHPPHGDGAEVSLHKNPITFFDKCQNLHTRGLHVAFAEFREITKQGGLHYRTAWNMEAASMKLISSLPSPSLLVPPECATSYVAKHSTELPPPNASTGPVMFHSWRVSTPITHDAFSIWRGLTE